jgi:uncharacterized protein with FMN-binding domain
MKIKKWVIPLIIAAVLLITAATIFFITMGKYTSAYNNFDFSDIDLSAVADGTYNGSEDGGIVKASVQVTVLNHAITEVKILSHDNGKGKPAEVITNDIVANNSLEVDTISGATYSSNVIRMAVYNALTGEQ